MTRPYRHAKCPPAPRAAAFRFRACGQIRFIPASAGIWIGAACRASTRPDARIPASAGARHALIPAATPNSLAGIPNSPRISAACPLVSRTSVRYADTRVKQPGRRQLSSALLRLPPPHRPAYDGHRGGKSSLSCEPNRTTLSTNESTNRFTPTPGENSGSRAAGTRPNLCRNHLHSWPRLVPDPLNGSSAFASQRVSPPCRAG